MWDERLEPVQLPGELPAVDFTDHAVVGVSHGWGACETFGIVRMTRYGDDLRLEWRLASPPPNMGCAGVLTPHYDFVLVPASIRGRVEFVQVN